MAKTLIEAFDDVFAKEVRRARNYSEAYERAAQDFQNTHGFVAPFDGYDSFRKKKERSKKRG